MRIKWVAYVLLICTLLCIYPVHPIWAAGSPRIVFLCPSTGDHHPFWSNYIAFMRAAAMDLGIDLNVAKAADRYAMVDQAQRILSSPQKPDYFVTVYLKGTGSMIMDMAAKAGVPIYLVNTVVPSEDRGVVGWPRGLYKNWIGSMSPDDMAGGHSLAQALIAAARKRSSGNEEVLHMAAISGSRDSTAALERNQGLRKALGLERAVVLDRLLFGFWKEDTARDKVGRLLRVNPDLSIVWTASDRMALGVCKAVIKAGKVPGRDVLVGGFDWSEKGLTAVEAGTFVASVGGHFMEGAWALVFLYDYHKGFDFAPIALEYRMPMYLLSADNVVLGRRLLDPAKWDCVDFKSFSRAHNGSDTYDFSLETILDCLGEKQ